ncbi:unnamed protein product [Ilex paraguariensis]|uniref:Uncharacterized protein n=1 Tax=Ilex paraguariensis TaxID=185542 RepID=A0ABC8TIR2_9AQUA
MVCRDVSDNGLGDTLGGVDWAIAPQSQEVQVTAQDKESIEMAPMREARPGRMATLGEES